MVVGRKLEMARLDCFFGRLSHDPSALVIEGDAGIGKTTLLGAAMAAVPNDRWPIAEFGRANRNDSLMGGPGLTAGPDPITRDTDVLNGGSGVDTVSFAGRTLAVVADIDGTPDDGVFQENDNILSNVENIVGGEGNDTLTGSILGNTLSGGNGNDTIDVLDGLEGNDTADGMAYRQPATGGSGNNPVPPGTGS